MKYHILHVFGTSAAFMKNSYDLVKDICKLKLLTNFDVNIASFLGGVPNYVSNL